MTISNRFKNAESRHATFLFHKNIVKTAQSVGKHNKISVFGFQIRFSFLYMAMTLVGYKGSSVGKSCETLFLLCKVSWKLHQYIKKHFFWSSFNNICVLIYEGARCDNSTSKMFYLHMVAFWFSNAYRAESIFSFFLLDERDCLVASSINKHLCQVSVMSKWLKFPVTNAYCTVKRAACELFL